MRLKHSIVLCLSFFLTCVCTLTYATDALLNGIAIHSDLGKEQFIGALYTNPLSDNADTLLASAQAMRMELKIVAPEGITTRRFSRWWIEGMAINNPPALLTDQADSMVKFDGLFKGRFIPNDDIVFSYEPTKGVNIFVNDVQLGNIASEKLFGMLLRTWIGKVPLSSDYKVNILKVGIINPELKGRFDKIKPTKERSVEIAAWSKYKSPADLAAEAAAKSTSSQSSSVVDTKVVAAQQKAEATAKAEAAKAEAAKLAAQKAADEEEKPALTAQSLLARQFFVSDLLKKIRTNTRYPPRSIERGQAGSVRIAVVVNRQGAVLSTSLLEGSEYDALNDAALAAINKSAPFPELPEAITGSTFEFTVPTTFTLPK